LFGVSRHAIVAVKFGFVRGPGQVKRRSISDET
jgi:hypothetical protein